MVASVTPGAGRNNQPGIIEEEFTPVDLGGIGPNPYAAATNGLENTPIVPLNEDAIDEPNALSELASKVGLCCSNFFFIITQPCTACCAALTRRAAK